MFGEMDFLTTERCKAEVGDAVIAACGESGH
jgi:hypothetical protein